MPTKRGVTAGSIVVAAALAIPAGASAAGWDVANVFTNQELVSLDNAELGNRKIIAHVVGDVELTSGRIIAADPLTLFGATPLARTVAPGRYRVTAYEAFGRLAVAAMRFADGKPDHWELALKPGQDIARLEKNQFFGYGVDTGLGCLMDAETMPLLAERDKIAELDGGDNYISYYDDVLADELSSTGHDFILHQPIASKKGSVAIFSSGWGDGFYGSYWGLDGTGRPLVLLTDFNVIQNSDGRKEPKW